MAVYLVERDVAGLRIDQLAAAQQAAVRVSRQFTAAGKPVRYLRGLFVPADGRWQCLFEAQDPVTVREVNHAVGWAYRRVVEALDLPPPDATAR